MSIDSLMLSSVYSHVEEPLRKFQDFMLENPQGKVVDYILKVHRTQTVFCFQQRTNMETNKDSDCVRPGPVLTQIT